MEREKLTRANELDRDIKKVASILNNWQGCKGLANNTVQVVAQGCYHLVELSVSPETFTIIRAINITHFSELLNEL